MPTPGTLHNRASPEFEFSVDPLAEGKVVQKGIIAWREHLMSQG